MEIDIPVVIAGGGPVGLNLAMFLARHGVKSVLLNTETETRWLPKGGTHNSRTMEHYRTLGIADHIRTLALPFDYPTDVAYFTSINNGFEILRQSMPSEKEKAAAVRAAGPTDQVPEPIFRGNQMYVERFLHQHAATFPEIELRFGWSCTHFRDEGDHVIVTARQEASGEQEIFRAAYLAGCDGARGLVRRELGIKYNGPPNLVLDYYGGPQHRVHIRAPEFYKVHQPALCAYYFIVSHNVRCNILSLNGKDEFILGTRRVHEDPAAEDERLRKLFCTAAGRDMPVEIISRTGWTSGISVVAESYGRGRVWLAGDAAHLTGPTGGFGMNTGIDDAVNLAWKLAAAVQGWGGPKLLPSYEAEREPIGRRNVGASRALASGLEGGVHLGDDYEKATPAGDEQRKAVGVAIASSASEAHASLGIQLGARYDGSSVIAGDGSVPPPDDLGIYTPTTIPGGRTPHLWLDGHVSLFDKLGPCFSVLCMNGDTAGAAPLLAAAKKRGVPMQAVPVTSVEGRALYERDLVVVRPDQIVAWRGDKAPDDPDALIARITGW